MRTWRALRALLRVELREIRRHPGRSWLVILLVAVPVAAMVGGSTLHQITRQTPEDARAHAMGRAVLRVDAGAGAELQAGAALLPAHARVEHIFSGHEDVSVPGRRLSARFLALPPSALSADGLAAGMLHLASGRAPSGAGEVALSPVLLQGLRRSPGEQVTLGQEQVTITGVVVDPEDLDLPIVLRVADIAQPRGAHALLVEVPESDAASVAAELRAAGLHVSLRSDVGDVDDLETLAIFVIGGFGFFEAALVIAAAFAVSLRRRQREIGLLGSTGASGAEIRASLLLAAAVLAVSGGLIGVVVGTGAGVALHPFVDEWNGRLNGGFEWSAAHVLGALLLGLLTALAAAALPAWSATRLPIRVALSGRRPVTTGSGKWLVLGVGMVVGGLALMLWGTRSGHAAAGVCILGGSALGLLGFGACSPWLLGFLAGLAAPLPLAWRLAVRDAGRFRARNGPVVTAVLAGISISVLVAALLTSIESMLSVSLPVLRTDQLMVHGPGAEEVSARLAADLSCVALAPLQAAYSGGELVLARFEDQESGGVRDAWVASGEEELLQALGGLAGVEALREGKLLSLGPALSDGEVKLLASPDRELAPLAIESVTLAQRVSGPLFLLGSRSLAGMGLQSGLPPRESLVPWLMRLGTPVTPDVLQRAQSIAADSVGTSIDADLLRRTPDRIFYRVILLICFVTGLIVIAVATALTSVESAADAAVLHTVGASPRVLRAHLAARAGYLAFLGCALAIPAGMIPAVGLLSMTNPGVTLPLEMPWPQVLTVVLGLPAIAYGGTWVFAALRRAPAWTGHVAR